MQCGDLERYLEAFLDGRLGRSRSAILRRHLTLCGGCRARIERLRQFERDMQRRFRSMDQDRSIWQGLELDLVASGRASGSPVLALPRLLPPPRSDLAGELAKVPMHRPRHPLLAMRSGRGSRQSRLAGVVLIAMALGALYQLGSSQFAPATDIEAAERAYAQMQEDVHGLAIEDGDPQRLEEWLARELGTPVELPSTPAGFELVGADRVDLPSGPAGAALYRSAANGTVLLLVHALAGEGAAASAADETAPIPSSGSTGLNELSWNDEAQSFLLVSALAPDELRRFLQ